MVLFSKLSRRRKRKQNGKPKEKPGGVPDDDDDDDDDNDDEDTGDDDKVPKLPCKCYRCKIFLQMHRNSRLPYSCPRRKGKTKSCCPYCDKEREKLTDKNKLLTKSPISSHTQTEPTSPQDEQIQTSTSSVSLQEESYVSISSPSLKKDKDGVPISLSEATSTEVNSNKIPSNLRERKQHQDDMDQGISDAETLASSRYSMPVDAGTQTKVNDLTGIPGPSAEQVRSYPATENEPFIKIYYTDKTEVGESLGPENQQELALGSKPGVCLLCDDNPNAKTLSSSSEGITEPLPENAFHLANGKSSESGGPLPSSSKGPSGELHRESEVPLHSIKPGNAIYPRYKYVKQERTTSQIFYIYAPVDESPKQSSTSGYSSQEPDSHESNTSDKQPHPKHPIENTSLPIQHCTSCGAAIINDSAEQEINKHSPEEKIADKISVCYCKDSEISKPGYINKPQTSSLQQNSKPGISEFPIPYTPSSMNKNSEDNQGIQKFQPEATQPQSFDSNEKEILNLYTNSNVHERSSEDTQGIQKFKPKATQTQSFHSYKNENSNLINKNLQRSSIHNSNIPPELPNLDPENVLHEHNFEHTHSIPQETTKLQTPCPVNKKYFEEVHSHNQMRGKKLRYEEDLSVESIAEPTKKWRNVLKTLKSFFFRISPVSSSSSVSEIHEANAIDSEKHAKQVKNRPEVPHESMITEDAYKTNGRFQTKYKEIAFTENISRTEIIASEKRNEKSLVKCMRCNHCAYSLDQLSALAKTKERKSSVQREKGQKQMLPRSKEKTLSKLPSSLDTNKNSSLNRNNCIGCNNFPEKHSLPDPFCLWFEVIDIEAQDSTAKAQ